MTRDARTFLALVRDAEDPTPADEARVLLALRATLAAGATSSLLASASRDPLLGARTHASFGALGSKWLLAGALAASLATGDAPLAPAAITARDRQTDAPAPLFSEPPAPLEPASHAPEPALVPDRVDPAPSPNEPPAPAQRDARARREPRAPRQGGLRSELELLERVQLALRRGDARAALRALDAHRTDDRVLLAERRAARILALCALGRVEEARAAAAEFEREHPDSVQRTAIASSCANAQRIDAPRAVIGHEIHRPDR